MGPTQYNEPGVSVAFAETAEERAKNVASLGFDLEDLIKRKKLIVDYTHLEQNEIEETTTAVFRCLRQQEVNAKSRTPEDH